MSPARYRARDVQRATGMTTHRLSQMIDRGKLRLSADDINVIGSGRCRRFTASTLRKAALLDALTKSGLPPGRASVLTEQHCQAQVTPGDLLIINTAGEGRITREIKIGTVGQIVLDLGRLFSDLDAALAA